MFFFFFFKQGKEKKKLLRKLTPTCERCFKAFSTISQGRTIEALYSEAAQSVPVRKRVPSLFTASAFLPDAGVWEIWLQLLKIHRLQSRTMRSKEVLW